LDAKRFDRQFREELCIGDNIDRPGALKGARAFGVVDK